MTLVHLPSPSGASSATPTTTLSNPAIAYERKVATQAALVQRKLSIEVAKLATESVQLAKEKAALAQERLTLQRDVIALARSSNRSKATSPKTTTLALAPVTHATTGASSTQSDGGNDGGNDGN